MLPHRAGKRSEVASCAGVVLVPVEEECRVVHRVQVRSRCVRIIFALAHVLKEWAVQKITERAASLWNGQSEFRLRDVGSDFAFDFPSLVFVPAAGRSLMTLTVLFEIVPPDISTF